MPLVHILRDLKERTEAIAEGARVSAANESETKEQIPSAPPVCIGRTLGTVEMICANMPLVHVCRIRKDGLNL